MWLRMAVRTAICCSSEPVMMYEKERNRQLHLLIRLIWFGGLRSTFGPPGLSLFDIRPRVVHALCCHCSSTE